MNNSEGNFGGNLFPRFMSFLILEINVIYGKESMISSIEIVHVMKSDVEIFILSIMLLYIIRYHCIIYI